MAIGAGKVFKRIIWQLWLSVIVLAYWRGVWDLTDQKLFPKNIVASTWTSFAIGLGGFVLYAAFTQVCFGKCVSSSNDERIGGFVDVAESRSRFDRLVTIIAYLLHFHLVSLFAIQAWRGLWYVQQLYILPDDPQMSSLISIAFGVVCSTIFSVVSSIHAAPYTSTDDFKGWFELDLTDVLFLEKDNP